MKTNFFCFPPFFLLYFGCIFSGFFKKLSTSQQATAAAFYSLSMLYRGKERLLLLFKLTKQSFRKIDFFRKKNFLQDNQKIRNLVFPSCQNFENLKIFCQNFKNRKISKCSKIDYFHSILLKRAHE